MIRARCRRALVLLSIAVFASSLCATSTQRSWASQFTHKYDKEIKKAVDRWWPGYRYWLAWKAQLYQESRLDPNARSPAGAEGIAQFMGPTWMQVAKALGYDGLTRTAAEPAIQAGAWYMANLRGQWRAPRPEEDRHQLAQASYNAGLGNILEAQRECGNAALYSQIIACLPQVTGRHSEETILYVQRIKNWRKLMEAEGH